MPVQGSVHNVQRAPHQTLGTRTRRRGRADAARSEPTSHACAPRNRRASVRHAEDADGCDTLSNEAVAQCRDRNCAERTRLQPHARNEHRRHQAAPGGNPGVKSSCCYAHRVTVQVAQRGPRLRPGRLQTRYSKNMLKPSCRRGSPPVACSFWGRKNVFTQPGSFSEAGSGGRKVRLFLHERTSLVATCPPKLAGRLCPPKLAERRRKEEGGRRKEEGGRR